MFCKSGNHPFFQLGVCPQKRNHYLLRGSSINVWYVDGEIFFFHDCWEPGNFLWRVDPRFLSDELPVVYYGLVVEKTLDLGFCWGQCGYFSVFLREIRIYKEKSLGWTCRV